MPWDSTLIGNFGLGAPTMSLWWQQLLPQLPWSSGPLPADSWPPAKSPPRSRANNPVSGQASMDQLRSAAYSPTRRSKPISALDVIKRFLRAWGTTWRCLMTPPTFAGTGTMHAGTAKSRPTRKTPGSERGFNHLKIDLFFRADHRGHIKPDRNKRVRIFAEPMSSQATESLLLV